MTPEHIFQSIRQGILICDRQSKIVYFNEAYGNFIGKRLTDVKGLPIRQLRLGSQIPRVLDSGRPLECVLRHENGSSYFANIYPIMEGEQINGAISIVTTLSDASKIEEKDCRSLKERTRQFEQQQIQKLLAIYGEDTAGKRKVAEILDISLASLYNKLADF